MRLALLLAAILVLFNEVKSVVSFHPDMNEPARICKKFDMKIMQKRYHFKKIENFNISVEFEFKNHVLTIYRSSANYSNDSVNDQPTNFSYSIRIRNGNYQPDKFILTSTAARNFSVAVGEIKEGELDFMEAYKQTSLIFDLAEFLIRDNEILCKNGLKPEMNGSCESTIQKNIDEVKTESHYRAQCADFPSTPTTTPRTSPSTSTTATSTTTAPSKTTGALQHLANINITSSNIAQVVNDTKQILSNASKITYADLYYSSEIVSNCSKLKNITKESFQGISAIIDECLGADTEQFHSSYTEQHNTTSRFLDAIENLSINTPSNAQYLNGKRIALVSVNCDQVDREEHIGGIADDGTEFSLVDATGNAVNGTPQASIYVPRNVTCPTRASKVYFAAYRTYNLFVTSPKNANASSIRIPNPQDRCSNGDFLAGSAVLTATLLGNETAIPTSLPKAILRYSKRTYSKPLHGEFALSLFDRTAAEWLLDDKHCEMIDSTDTDYYEFNCYHLTDFALIISGMQTDPSLCSAFLANFGLVICILSTLSLAVLLIAHILRFFPACTQAQQIRLLCMVISVLLVIPLEFCNVHCYEWISRVLMGLPQATDDPTGVIYIVVSFSFFFTFTVFIDQNVAGHGCVLVAQITYTLFMSCILITLLQSLHILTTFVPILWLKKFLDLLSKSIVKLVIVAVVPIIITVGMSVSINNFFKRDDRFCWIRPDYVVMGVALPLGLVCVNGVICFMMIVLNIYPPAYMRRAAPAVLTTSRSIERLKIITLFVVQFFLGIPWLMQYLTLFQPKLTIFHYLFTLVNGSRGVILLVITAFRTWYVDKSKCSVYWCKKRSMEASVNDNGRRDDPLDSATIPDREPVEEIIKFNEK